MRQFVCATCTYPSRNLDGCDNPVCFANPSMTEEHKTFLRERAKKAANDRAEETAKREFKDRLHRAGFRTI